VKTRIIPANKPTGKAETNGKTDNKTRVAAYCRVSTDKEEQESSYEVQCQHYESLISVRKDWELAGIYADEGITALSTRKREQFRKMIRDCEEGKIDLIITKSISRFARNTLDCLNYIRKLKSMNIPIIFEKESINTMDSKGELLITIMASIAQQESESISRNVQIGVRYRFQEGRVCSGHHRLLGYERTEEGKLAIVPEEARIVMRIYREYLDGYSPGHIGERLKNDQYVDRRGVKRTWNISSVRYILSNEKYMGDLLLQKYYTVDFLSKKVAANHGQMPQYYVENSHEPIIPRDIFYRVQGEILRRKKEKDHIRYLHESGLSGRIFCEKCGCPYFRKKGKKGENTYFRCATRLKKPYKGIECDNKSISEDSLKNAFVDAMNYLPGKKEDLIRLQERVNLIPIAQADHDIESLSKEMDILMEKQAAEHSEREADEIARQMEELEIRLSSVSEKRAEYAEKEMNIRNLLERIRFPEMKDDVSDILSYSEMYEPVPQDNKEYENHPAACRDPEAFFRRTAASYPPGPVTEYRDDDVIKFIKKIIVGENITVLFKAGIEIRLKRL